MPSATSIAWSRNPDIDGLLIGTKWSATSLTYSFPVDTLDNGFDNFANGVASDCGAEQPTYIFGSMPGLGTTATFTDGTPMHNWWVYLFY